jgi:hypothetical protein
VFPNPAKSNLTIQHIASNKIIITDVQGKVVQQIAVTTNTLNVNIDALPKGIYFVKDAWRIVRFVKE